MTALRALLWDVDGTLAETERDGHRVAFNQAFEAFDLPWRWSPDHYGRLLDVTGGRERLLHDMRTRADAPAEPQAREALASALHLRKNAFYAELVAQGGIGLREGVPALLQACRAQGVRMAVATTTSRANLEALLRAHLGPHWDDWFDGAVCGEDVLRKKPDPQVYQLALHLLGLQAPETLAIEDAPAGVAAALAAGCPVLVTRSAYFADAPVDAAVLAVGPGLHTLRGWQPAPPALAERPVALDDLRHWHGQHARG